MYLIAGDDRHMLREGITLVGSEENDRYNCIRLQSESICPKHAALRWCAATKKLDVMDLCSHGGTQMENDSAAILKEIQPLEWHTSALESTIIFGTFKARLESSNLSPRKHSLSFFAEDDSVDVVDCSLEEPPQIKSRTESKRQQQSNISCTLVNTTTANPAVRENKSFLIPATQQMNTTNANSSTLPLANSATFDNATTQGDEDDMFFIPETQEQHESSITEQIIDPIANTIGLGEKDDDYLRFETQDDENTGDGMFNNPYVEQSQNLLHNLDESYQRDSAKPDQRKSIIPDRSVDSISFHGKITAVDTDEDLSKIEWNDTKSAENPTTAREESITPELAFDKPNVPTVIQDPAALREHSITPDLEFDRITPLPKELTADTSRLSLVKLADEGEKHRQQSITPDLDFEHLSGENEDDAEISLNQEGALNPYDLQTQPIFAEPISYDSPTKKIHTPGKQDSFRAPSVDAYDLLTQQMSTKDIEEARPLRKLNVGLINLKSSMKDVSFKINKYINLNPFEVATQSLPPNEPEDIYELQTQILSKAPNDTIPLGLPPPSTSKIKRNSKRLTKTREIDPFAIATQPLQNDTSKNMYDLQTQPLHREESDDQNDTIPLDIVFQSSSRSPSEAYDLQTQLLAARQSHSGLGDDDPEMSKLFLPKVNSTYRQSILEKQITNQEECEKNQKADKANISPSSNKENRAKSGKRHSSTLDTGKLKANSPSLQESEALLKISQPIDEGLDDEFCLASTLPVADSSSKSLTSGIRPDRKKDEKSLFKMPGSSAASSTKSSINTDMETPRAKKGSSSEQSVETDTFDFNTPEHPFLNAVKKDSILAISDIITSRRTKANSTVQRNKYIFGDSSDEDEDPTLPVFQKKDNQLRVMKYDKDEVAAKETKPNPETVPERRSKRDRKPKNNGYEEEETSAAAEKQIKADRKPKLEDESIEYKPPNLKASRKRQAPEIKSEPPPSDTKSGKSRKTIKSEPEPKAGPSSKIEEKPVKRSKRGEQAIDKVVPKVEDEQGKHRGKSSRPSRTNPGNSEDEPSVAKKNTNSSGSDSSGRARKSSRASKPRLIFTKLSPEPYRQIITRSGALIVDIPDLATVLVSDRIYRTCKFLCAMAKGIPIVGQPYLEALNANQEFVDPWDYILQDHEMERRFKFNLKKSLTLAREAKFLEDYSVIITPSIMPPPEEVQLIVTSAGGRVIKFSSQQPKHADKTFVVSDIRDKALWPKFREHYPKIEIISTEGFMLSIMQHYKNFRSHLLA